MLQLSHEITTKDADLFWLLQRHKRGKEAKKEERLSSPGGKKHQQWKDDSGCEKEEDEWYLMEQVECMF